MVELSRAQKLLVAKSLAAKREKQSALECKQIADGTRQQELTRKKTIALDQKKSHATKLLLHYVNKDLATFALKSPTKSIKMTKKSKNVPQESIVSTKEAVVNDFRIEEDERYHRPPRPRPVNPWAKMYELEVKEVKEEEQKRRQNHLEKMQQTKQTLNHQHEEKLKKKAENHKLELEQYRFQQQQLAQYKIDLENAQLAKEKKQKEANADFARMIEEARVRKDKQHQAQVRTELKEVEKAKLALEMERQRLDREKQFKAKEVERVKLENKALQEMKRQALLKEQEDDRRTTKEYQERLAQQERKRLEALEQTYARQEKRVNLALLNVVSEAEKALIDEKRAKKIQAEIEAKEDARYRQKQNQLEESNAIQKLALKKQQDERLQAIKNEIEYNKKADKDWIEDTLAAEMKERAKQAKKHAQDKAYREKLSLQMLNEQKKKETTDKWAMDKTEIILNADRLRKAGIPVKPKE
ncbi:hypothetical protein THRCLA_08417 [Thraustotheca clavata]|uniref:Trichohyalin-plectin-homology domain-containing protein n=1 Tax=Thraustotheca clavata TaxID=74557 RepID=A0A1V9Z6J1_9STRA|nr:hypothetical protein THRCLA_08417 [Thraustotheca clavata]